MQMLMERSLLAIVSLMIFQIFEALYINCELGSGVTVVYKHHNNTIRLTIQHKAALTIVLLDVLYCYDVFTPL